MDLDHLSLAEQNLRRTPDERLDQMLAGLELLGAGNRPPAR
jgi:hypothetical protein